ncbi:hypothetical protein L6452_35002 [Arctium lappa]|uniref:Uncharacterized protein n=1 Tax=Arctium lappa TaxID=4217 RepID=A0ACB8YKA2_ARCLA|nr:hypothetical protein L6452_35002 [Arctium lappa]
MRVLTSRIAKDARSTKRANSVVRVLSSRMTLNASISSFPTSSKSLLARSAQSTCPLMCDKFCFFGLREFHGSFQLELSLFVCYPCTNMVGEHSHDPIVQMDENDPNVSKETPMPSSRSHVQSVISGDLDLALINPTEYLLLSPNNHHVDFDNLNVNPLVIEILKDNFTSVLTYRRLRLIFDLPEADSREGRATFDLYHVNSEVFEGIRALGYVGQITKISLDNTNMHTLRLFHAIVYDLHVDYSVSFWTELYEKVISKSKKPLYVPYQRFHQLIVRSMIRSNIEIPKRSHHEVAPECEMRYLQKQKKTFSNFMPIPAALLAYADPDSECVREYKESMGLPEPAIPTQDSNLRREESVRVLEAMGVQERVELRENLESGIEGGQDSRLEAVETQAHDATYLEVSISQPERDITHQLRPQVEIIDEGQNSETESDQPACSSTDSVPSATPGPNEGHANDDDVDNDHLQYSFGFLDDISRHHEDMEIDTVVNTIQDVLGDIRRIEGVQVENFENVRPSVNVEKEYGERVCTRTYQSKKATASNTLSHVLRVGIQDITSPLMQMHTSATHSIASQQAIVSVLHGDLAQTLSSFHSEILDIENRAQLPQSSIPFSAQSCLAPIELPLPIPRTLIQSATIGHLSDPIGTSVVEPQSGLQGSDGSPVIAYTMPTLNTSHTVESSTVVPTGSLSGLRVTLPDFVSKEFFNGALKAVEDRLSQKFETELGKVKSLLKGKGPVVEEPVQPPPPPPIQSVDLSVEELKSLLYVKLLSQVPADESEAYLVGLLRSQQAQEPSDTVLATEINAFKSEVVQHIQELTRAVQQVCKVQAVTKRRHDHDSDQDHEGEISKKQRTITETEATQGDVEMEEDVEMADVEMMSRLQVVDVIDLSSDKDESTNEKYEKFLKVKEDEREHLMDSDEEGNENILDIRSGTPDDIKLSPVHHELPEITRAQANAKYSESTVSRGGDEKIFVHRIRRIDIYKVLGVSHLPMEYQEEYARLISWERKAKKYVKNKSGIVTLKQVRLRRFQKILYPVFKVQRRDLTESELKQNQKRVNMTKPNLELEDIEIYDLFPTIEKPELGVIYKYGENKNRFLKISEIAKFLDGTMVIKLLLNQRFKENEKKLKQGKKGHGKFNRLA